MAYDEHHEEEYSAAEGGLYTSAAATEPDHAARHRRRLMAGTTVAVVALATAGFLATRLVNEQQPTLPEPAALAPQTTPATAEPTPVDTAPVIRTPITRHAAPVERSPAPSVDPSLEASPEPGEAAASAAIGELRDRLRISSRTTTAEHPYEDGAMTVVAAWRDVTGESLLKRAQDAGAPAGNGVRCTTRVSNEPEWEPGRPPTLMCWRTSATRSVVVVSSASTAGAEAVRFSASLIATEWPKRD